MTATGYRIGEFQDAAEEIRRLDSQANVVALLEDEAFERLGLPESGLGLDVGCGPGFVAQRLLSKRPNLELWGVDLDSRALALVNPEIHRVRAHAHALPFPDARFDFALTRLMLRHTPEPERAIAEMMRVVRPGGAILIEDCDDGAMIIDPLPESFQRVSEARYASLRRRGAEPFLGRRLPGMLRAAGLTSIQVRPISVTSEDVGVETFMKIALLPIAEAIDPDLLAAEQMSAARDSIVEWARSPRAFGMTTLLTMRGIRP
jgi:ubiquinone/menaquinone biosynthesis C-methylase UbiE